MDLTQIRYFLALAEARNFTRAAEQCNVTQPALSRSIQRLEDELGGPLVLRERSLTQLTDLGRTMLPLLQRTYDAARAVREQAMQHRRGTAAVPLRLGLAASVPVPAVLPLLREIARRVPGVELTLTRAEEGALAEALLRGDLDCAVLPEAAPLPDRLHRWPLWPQRVLVLAPEDHPAAAQPAIPAAALAEHGAVAALGGLAAAAFGRLEAEHAIAARPRHAGSGPEEVGALVSLGLGMALVPDGTPTPPGTVSRPLVDPQVSFPVVLAAAAGRPMNRAAGAFLKLARARRWVACGDQAPPGIGDAGAYAPARSEAGGSSGQR